MATRKGVVRGKSAAEIMAGTRHPLVEEYLARLDRVPIGHRKFNKAIEASSKTASCGRADRNPQ